jgi:hypothetical protein
MFKILEPEMGYINSATKHIDIIIKPQQISMDFHFECKLLITRNNEQVELEYPCGNMKFDFFVDILNNKYELKNFILEYDIDKCGPDILPNENENQQNKQVTKPKIKSEVVIPATIATAGIIATPFLLSVFGGKKKKL